MRFAYLDEAGTSDKEPVAVVAAVMIDVDLQYRPLSQALSDLADSCAPPDKRDRFIFHAKELYHGGKSLSRDRYPPEHGRGYLKSLAHIPFDNGMPVFPGVIHKDQMTGGFRPETALDRNNLYHAMAFIMALLGVEEFMREHCPDEMCQVVAEDHPTAKKMIRQAHNFLRSPEAASLPGDAKGILPLRHIVDVVNFASKTESSPLQLADAAAFILRRHMERRPDAVQYYGPLVPALWKVPVINPAPGGPAIARPPHSA